MSTQDNPTKLLSDIREIEYRQMKSIQRIERITVGTIIVLMTLVCLAVLFWVYTGLYL